MGVVPNITLLPIKVKLDLPPITLMDKFPKDPDLFDELVIYAADDKKQDQIVFFQRVVSQFRFNQIKYEFLYFKNY